jgi:hypothetical protein
VSRISVIAVFCALVWVGCGSVATKKSHYKPIVKDLRAGRFETAAARIDSARADNKYGEKDRLVYFLDAGFAHHYAASYDTSNQKLHVAEAAAEELFTKSISRAALSLLLNDNVLEYAGEDYELLYANIIKCLNFLLLNDFEGAFVEVRKVNERLNLLEDKYADASRILNQGAIEDTARVAIDYEAKKVRFYNDAFARWLSMHMYAADLKWDDARIDYDYMVDAFAGQPHIYPFEMPEVTYIPDSGKALLSIAALVGLSPVKEALNLRIRTDKDLDLVQILYTDGGKEDSEYGHLPLDVDEDYYFKFAIPKMVDRPSTIAAVRVVHEDSLLAELGLLEDVGLVSRETFEARASLIYLRSVARAVFKGLATHKLKERADDGGLSGWLKKAAIDVASDLTENADLRCARLLPGRIFVADLQVPPGDYNLTLEFVDDLGNLVARQDVEGHRVLPGNFNLVQAVSLR